jgi:hypothetical protein
MLQYSHFDDCIDLLKTPIEHLSPTNPEQSPLLGSAESIGEFFVEPFTLELEKELLSRDTPEQREHVIKWYISRLMKCKNHKPIIHIQQDIEATITNPGKELPHEGTMIKGLIIMDIPKTPSHDLKFKRGCNLLYHMLFDELQIICDGDGIPFLRICSALNFDITTIKIEEYSKYEHNVNFPAKVKSGNISQSLESLDSKHDIENAFAEIRKSDNRFWKGLPMDVVVDHFKVFTTKKSTNGRTFLSDDQFISFLRRGFLDDQRENKQTIHYSYGEKGFVIKRFYELYVLARDEFGFPQKKNKFITLITDCFDNWEKNAIVLLFKPNKSKDKW